MEPHIAGSASSASGVSWPLVSVVVPTRGRPDLLRRALVSIVEQTYPGPIECVVVHDQEEPDLMLTELGSPNRRIVVTTNDRTPGLAGARNSGRARTTGDYIASCDDDDRWHPRKLEIQMRWLGAIAAGRRLSDRVFGGQASRKLEYHTIPTVIFTHPTIGTVGCTEAQARERHTDVRVYRSSFVPLYHGVMERKPRSEMKLIAVGPEERIVGLHVIGPGADEMLQGFAVAVRMGARKVDFDDTVAIHPTSAEELVTMR